MGWLKRGWAALAAIGLVGNVTAGNSFTGPDKFWRPRQSMVFYFHNQTGKGFKLDLTLRDMNVYQEGPRPAFAWAIGPDGKILTTQFIPDDGIETNNPLYKDGIADIGLDLRYREFHRKNSPGGLPPGKERSPLLEHPDRIPARTFTLTIPAAGQGTYRLAVGSCWDHWLSVTPDRPMPHAVYPGSGSLYLHPGQMPEAFLYLPENVKDLGLLITEEIAPFNWRGEVKIPGGKSLGNIAPKKFANYLFCRQPTGRQVVKLELQGASTGASLHLQGAPMLLCPDAATAELFHGGADLQAGRMIFHPGLKVLLDWALNLKADDLRLNDSVRKSLEACRNGKQVTAILAGQGIDSRRPDFGRLKNFGEINLLADCYRDLNDPAVSRLLARRILLAAVMNKFMNFGPNFSFDAAERPFAAGNKSGTALIRSSWWPLNDALQAGAIAAVRKELPSLMTPAAAEALRELLRHWAAARYVMEQGECSNQWSYELVHLAEIAQAMPEDRLIDDILKFQIRRFTAVGGLGRTCPDRDSFALKSAVRKSYSADTGVIGGGVPAEIFGHDNEYCLESEANMAKVWRLTGNPEIITWLREYYQLKTHLTLPRQAAVPRQCFTDTCSPADINSRTRYYTHKTGLDAAMAKLIPYGQLWQGKTEERVWPCFENGSFVREIDHQYFMFKTPSYYAVVFGGAVYPEYVSWNQTDDNGSSFEYVGVGGMGYGGYQYMAKKPGGISALWIKGSGPALLGNNHNVMYSNVLWGRVGKPLFAKWGNNVDPRVVSDSYADAGFDYDAAAGKVTRSGTIPHTPLKFDRETTFSPNEITVRLTVTADEAVTLTQLHEAIPLYLEQRKLQRQTEKRSEFVDCPLPEPLVTDSHKSSDDRRNWGENPDLPEFTAGAVRLLDAGKHGIVITFDRPYRCTTAQPLRYRREAAAMGGISLALPTVWKKGQRESFSYRIGMLP